MKEISYIDAEGYPAGEMKHGPIALIDEDLPVVAVAPRDGVYEKMLSNIEEVKARSGIVIVVPKTHELLSPMMMVLPLQLLATLRCCAAATWISRGIWRRV